MVPSRLGRRRTQLDAAIGRTRSYCPMGVISDLVRQRPTTIDNDDDEERDPAPPSFIFGRSFVSSSSPHPARSRKRRPGCRYRDRSFYPHPDCIHRQSHPLGSFVGDGVAVYVVCQQRWVGSGGGRLMLMTRARFVGGSRRTGFVHGFCFLLLARSKPYKRTLSSF